MSARLALLLCFLAAPASTLATAPNSPAAVDEDLFFGELPVVLSVSRLAQPLADSPGSVTVIDAETIRTSGARNLADLLRTVPGFLVAQSTGGAPVAVYHGITDENPRGLQILVDGRSQYSPLFYGGVSWNLIDVALDDIERIEVVRGSNSAAYGSNAFLGVVNVVTTAAALTPGASVRVSQGDNGVADRYARVGMRLGGADIRLSAERSSDHGVMYFNDSRRNDRVNLRADLPLGLTDELQLQAGVVDLRLDAGEPVSLRLPPRVIETRKDFVSAAWLRNGADGSSTALRYSHSRERYSDVFFSSEAALRTLTATLGLPSPIGMQIDQQIRTERDELEFQHTLVPTVDTRLVWGAGTRHDRVHGRQLYGTSDRLGQEVHRLFGNLEWRPAPWVVNLGATLERDSLSDTSLAPRLSANYHLSSEQTVRAAITRAHRLPTLTESRARTAYGAFDTGLLGLPNGVVPVEITRKASGDLEPEQVDVQEIGYLADFHAQRLFIDVRAFREEVRNRITPVELATAPDCELVGLLRGNCGRATDFINGQDLVIRGLEYQLRWRPRASTDLTLNQTFIDIDSEAKAAFVARDQSAAAASDRHMEHSAPRLATMLRWNERLPFNVHMSIAYYRYARFQWTGDSSVGPFNRTDVRLAYPLRLGTMIGELALVVQGVGGRRAEYRERAAGAVAVTPEFLRSRGWLTLTLGI